MDTSSGRRYRKHIQHTVGSPSMAVISSSFSGLSRKGGDIFSSWSLFDCRREPLSRPVWTVRTERPGWHCLRPQSMELAHFRRKLSQLAPQRLHDHRDVVSFAHLAFASCNFNPDNLTDLAELIFYLHRPPESVSSYHTAHERKSEMPDASVLLLL